MAGVPIDMQIELRESGRVGVAMDLDVRLRALQEDYKEDIRRILEESAQIGSLILKTLVPHTATYFRDPSTTSIRETIEVKTSGVRYAPGGAGGGGYYTVIIDIGSENTPQLEWVLEGTGIYGPKGRRITSAEPMPFRPVSGYQPGYKETPSAPGKDGNIMRMSQRGQEPQTEWLSRGQSAINTQIRERLRRAGRLGG